MIDAIRGQARPLGASAANTAPDLPARVATSAPTRRTPADNAPEAAIAQTSDTTTDAALVAAAKRDIAAFAPLYDRYLGPIYRFCLSRLGGIDAAEDATAAIFVKALSALPTCRDAHFRPWLFAIARNVVVDTHRGTRPLTPIAAAAHIPDPAPSPTDIALATDAHRTVVALLAHLTPEQRDIVELRLAGLTGPEIARALGRSHVAIRVAQFRAYTRLRTLMRPDQLSTEAEPPHQEPNR